MKRLFTLILIAAVTVITHGQSLTSSRLPIIIIRTDGYHEIPDEPKIGAEMRILYVNDTTVNYLANQNDSAFLNYIGRIGIELRGSSSQNHSKKPYGFETRQNDGTALNVSLLGMPAENDWVLNPMNDEPSYVRDCLSYHLAGQLGHYAPRTRYCEVIVNGDYRGLYFLTEKIKVDENRVNVSKMDTADNTFPQVTGGYILKADKLTGGDVPAWSTQAYDYWQDVDYIYHAPKPEEITPAQGAYLHAYFDTVQAVVAAHNQDVSHGFPAYIDIPTFIDYMIMGEMTSNVDIYQKSTFFHKDRCGKLRAGPVWDFNLAYGYDFGEVGRSGYDVLQFANGDNTGSDFWHQLYEDNWFSCLLFYRWSEVTAEGGPLNFNRVIYVMDSLSALISEAITRDRIRWLKFYDYNEHIYEMKEWLVNRYAWLNHEWDLYRGCIPQQTPPLVITMINYHPQPQLGFDGDKLEFLALYNNGEDTVDASGFYFRELGVTYTFPESSLIMPHEEIFLVSNAEAFQTCFQKPAYGKFRRHLSNKSEKLVLADAWGNVIDEVTYRDSLPWPISADGHGDFLQLIDPDLDNRLPENWIASNSFVGVPDHPADNILRISPNPTTGIIRVESDKTLSVITLQDLQGRTILTVTEPDGILDLTPYPAGIYLITAKFRHAGQASGKVLKF